MTRIRIPTIIFFILLPFILSGCLNGNSNDYVATVGGEKVSVSEFKYYLYEVQQKFNSTGDTDIWDTDFEGMTAEEIAKERALTSIAYVKISAKQAKKMNITLTKEEKDKSLLEAVNTIESLDSTTLQNIGIDENSLAKIMEEKSLYIKVYNEITKNFELSEIDFEDNYNKYIHSEDVSINLKKRYDIQSIYISAYSAENGDLKVLSDEEKITSLKKAESIRDKAKSGEDFTDLVNQYSDDSASIARNGRDIISKGMYKTEFENAVFNLKEGEISEVVTMDYGYYIIKLNDIIEPDEQAIKEKFKNDYISSKKDQIFEQEYKNWENEIEKNKEILDTIKIALN